MTKEGGTGDPPQSSYLENPVDRGACEAAAHGVAESRTRLMGLSRGGSMPREKTRPRAAFSSSARIGPVDWSNLSQQRGRGLRDWLKPRTIHPLKGTHLLCLCRCLMHNFFSFLFLNQGPFIQEDGESGCGAENQQCLVHTQLRVPGGAASLPPYSIESCLPLLTGPCCSLVAKSSRTLCDPVDCGLPGSAVHEISQVRTLEWVATSFSRGFSGPRD